jgi:hypothetical protein
MNGALTRKVGAQQQLGRIGAFCIHRGIVDLEDPIPDLDFLAHGSRGYAAEFKVSAS